MMKFRILLLQTLVFGQLFIFATGNDVTHAEEEDFVATKDWQIVKPNQKIPRGLHVRTNLQTGVTEAKLMTSPPASSSSVASSTAGSTSLNKVINIPANKVKQPATPNLDEALKKLDDVTVKHQREQKKQKRKKKSDGEAEAEEEEIVRQKQRMFERVLDADNEHAFKRIASSASASAAQQHAESIKRQFKSYEELRRDFESLQSKTTSDAQIIGELVREYRNLSAAPPAAGATARKLVILRDLEYLLHQVDNSRDFAKHHKGLELLLHDLHASLRPASSQNLTSSLLWTLSAALQTNRPVQVAALQSGKLLPAIAQLLQSVAANQEAGRRAERERRCARLNRRIVTCLSVTTRQFPAAQNTFFSAHDGLALMSAAFDRLTSLPADVAQHADSAAHTQEGEPRGLPVQLSLITLISDWLEERHETKRLLAESANQKESRDKQQEVETNREKLRQYEAGRMEHRMQRGSGLAVGAADAVWCSAHRFDRLLHLIASSAPSATSASNSTSNSAANQRRFHVSHDSAEKILWSMKRFDRVCEWGKRAERGELEALHSKLVRIRDKYAAEAEVGGDPDMAEYFREIRTLAHSLVESISPGHPPKLKEEL